MITKKQKEIKRIELMNAVALLENGTEQGSIYTSDEMKTLVEPAVQKLYQFIYETS